MAVSQVLTIRAKNGSNSGPPNFREPIFWGWNQKFNPPKQPNPTNVDKMACSQKKTSF